MWKLSFADMSEIARNSVLISAFSEHRKKEFLGEEYVKGGVSGNSPNMSNVPNTRAAYRADTWLSEMKMVNDSVGSNGNAPTPNLTDYVTALRDFDSTLLENVHM